MQDLDYIRLAENEELSRYLAEKRGELMTNMLSRAADGSSEFSVWSASQVMRLQLLEEIRADIDESAQAAKRRLEKTQ